MTFLDFDQKCVTRDCDFLRFYILSVTRDFREKVMTFIKSLVTFCTVTFLQLLMEILMKNLDFWSKNGILGIIKRSNSRNSDKKRSINVFTIEIPPEGQNPENLALNAYT